LGTKEELLEYLRKCRQCGIEMRDKMTFRELLEKVVFDEVWITLNSEALLRESAATIPLTQ
jgi:hypothetical protein